MRRNPVTIAVVDYGLGNLFSIRQACEHAGMAVVVSGEAAEIKAADAVLLPGVGAFADAMAALDERGLSDLLRGLAGDGKPLIGICLGQQLLMSESLEFGRHAGLGLIEGTVERLPADATEAPGGRPLKVPRVGWKRIHGGAGTEGWKGTPLEGLSDGDYMYFVHSYYVRPADSGVVLSTTDFGGMAFCSSLARGNIFACQFHPERSGSHGLMVYDNMARILTQGELFSDR